MKDLVKLQVPTPFPVGPVNVYLIKRDPLTIIDTGPNTDKAKKALTEALACEGIAVADIKRVLITHAHMDHAGLAGWLARQGASIHIHPYEAKKLSGISYLPVREAFLQQMGTPQEKINSFRASAQNMASEQLADFTPLLHGSSIEFTDLTLTVIETPGHCGGHVAFYDQQSGSLFGGDTILEYISPNPMPELDPHTPGTRSPSLSQMLATLTRLENMSILRVHPGHGNTILNIKERITTMRNLHEKRLKQVHTGLSTPKTAYHLATDLYGDLSGWNVFLGLAETCAHLDLLIERGLAQQTCTHNHCYYQQTQTPQ